MAKSYKSIIKDQIRSDKRELENAIKKGMPIDFVWFYIDEIKKDYNNLLPKTKTEALEHSNFIQSQNKIIERATKARINFIKFFLGNLENEQEIFKKSENVEGMKQEMENLKRQLVLV